MQTLLANLVRLWKTTRTPTANVPMPREIALQRLDATESGTLARWTWGFVALGLLLRTTRYLLCFPLWCDECYIAAHFIDRDYAGLLQPLDYFQVCPILFLWAELSIVRLFGFYEWSLRLLPFVSSLGSMLLFRHLAVRLLAERPRLVAVAVFAVSFYPIRHATEVKSYALDLFAALVLIVLAVEWLHARQQARWLWCLALATPLCLGFSYPAVFIAGAVSLALAVPVLQRRKLMVWCSFAAFNLLLLTTFVGLLSLVADRQYEHTAEGLTTFWGRRFPPLETPWKLPAWLFDAHTGRMFAYPVGDDHGMSTASFVLCCLGALALWRMKARPALVLLVAPLPAMFVAAALHRYPYGGSGRVFQHLVPAICLLMALGASQVIAWVHRESWRFRGHARVAGALALLGIGILGLSIARPYKQKFDREMRDLAEVVWDKGVDEGELLCLANDAREEFARKAFN
ncbi:MAG TPA: hypothetical protein VHB77_12185, partial [Planctomycetaceae bacterium]|nr:hypothetical protein [Planctomycetaceae bacterium]